MPQQLIPRLSSEWNNCSFGTVDVDSITKKVAEYNKAHSTAMHARVVGWTTRGVASTSLSGPACGTKAPSSPGGGPVHQGDDGQPGSKLAKIQQLPRFRASCVELEPEALCLQLRHTVCFRTSMVSSFLFESSARPSTLLLSLVFSKPQRPLSLTGAADMGRVGDAARPSNISQASFAHPTLNPSQAPVL